MTKIKLLSALTAGMFLGLGGAAHAGYFSSTLVNGVNKYEDQSREAYVDVDGDGNFNTGDVLVGFLRLDNKTQPNGIDLQNRVYMIFSQQVLSVAGPVVTFGATTAAGLTMSDLGIAGAGANDMFAVVTKGGGGFSDDILITSPGDRTGDGFTTLKDYYDLLLDEGEVEMIGGMYAADDLFTAFSAAAGGPNSAFVGIPASVTVSNFVGGLSTSVDPNGVTVFDATPAGIHWNGAGITVNEVAFTAGVASGTLNVVNEPEWTNASELIGANGYKQCTVAGGASVACGFINKLDFSLTVEKVPEPATLGLLGLGLLGMGAALRRRKA